MNRTQLIRGLLDSILIGLVAFSCLLSFFPTAVRVSLNLDANPEVGRFAPVGAQVQLSHTKPSKGTEPLFVDSLSNLGINGSFSVSFWVNPAQSQKAEKPYLLNLLWIGNPDEEARPLASLWVNAITNNFHISSANGSFETEPFSFQTDQPSRLTLTYDQNSGSMRWYWNKRSLEYTQVPWIQSHFFPLNSAGNLQIRLAGGLAPQTQMHGQYRLTVWPKMLTEAEVAQVHQTTSFKWHEYLDDPKWEPRRHLFRLISGSLLVVSLLLLSYRRGWINYKKVAQEMRDIERLTLLILAIMFLLMWLRD